MTSSSASAEGHGIPPSAIRDVYIIVRRDNEILLLLRSSTGYKDCEWGLPSGKVESGETYLEAGARELLEETGIHLHPSALRFVHVIERHPKDDAPWIGVFFEVQPEDPPENREPERHGAMQWFADDQLPDKTVDYVRHVVEAIVHGSPYTEWRDA